MIVTVSYNARYAKLRGAKNAHFPDFLRFSPGWLIFGLGSTVLHILHFLSYYIVFFVTRLQIVSALCALHRFVCNAFYSSKHLCACFITFYAAFYNLQFAAMVVHLLLRRHYFARFYQIVSMDAPAWIARIVIKTHGSIRSNRIMSWVFACFQALLCKSSIA